MRYKIKKKPPLKEGAVRVKSGFLIFPKCIGGEWRWLETALWKQEAVESYDHCHESGMCSVNFKWVNKEWIHA